MPEWWNGRHCGLKIRWQLNAVPVQIRSRVPFFDPKESIKMHRSEMKKFIQKISHNFKNIKIVYIEDLEYKMTAFVGWKPLIKDKKHWVSHPYIFLNKPIYNEYKKDKWEIRMMLIHEIGHCESMHGVPLPTPSSSKKEYLAHTWAIKKASQLNMKTLTKKLIDRIENWKEYNWNSNRVYRIANILYSKNRKKILKSIK